MRSEWLLPACIALLMSTAVYSQEEASSGSPDTERFVEQEEEGTTRENGCYPVNEEEFMVGDRIYRWFVYPSGRRVLRCREIYYDAYCGIYFGPWETAVYFTWHHFHPWHFTYCPVLHMYYYNHPHYVWHYHQMHYHVYNHVYVIHKHHWAHFKWYTHWKPWHYPRNNRWAAVTGRNRMTTHAYKPHQMAGKKHPSTINKTTPQKVHTQLPSTIKKTTVSPQKQVTTQKVHTQLPSTIKKTTVSPQKQAMPAHHTVHGGSTHQVNKQAAQAQKQPVVVKNKQAGTTVGHNKATPKQAITPVPQKNGQAAHINKTAQSGSNASVHRSPAVTARHPSPSQGTAAKKTPSPSNNGAGRRR